MDYKPKLSVEWFVIFTRSKKKTWFLKWLKKDFSHVYAMTLSPGKQFWIVVNPISAFLDYELLMVDKYPHPRLYAEQGAVILPVKAIIPEQERWTLCIFNCVEVVKALLGIRAFWIFTPWQLYKHLTKRR